MRLTLNELRHVISEELSEVIKRSMIPYHFGAEVGEGSEGTVYEVDADRVIKIGSSEDSGFVDRVERLAKRMMHSHSPDTVKVFDFGRYERPEGHDTVYWILMERLHQLDEEEVALIEDYLQFAGGGEGTMEDEGPRSPGLQRAIDRELVKIAAKNPKLANFLRHSMSKLADLSTTDNVMKSADGEYKVIDPEGLAALWED